MSVPVWWPPVYEAADRRRYVTGLFLARATVDLHDGAVRLRFDTAARTQVWHDSGAQIALEAALRAAGHDIPVRVGQPTV
ncbi:hypothetical protein [Streptomyces sp. SID4982]|uniref:hypothetical protein n=1 Tax=Streptomyces sp. SID4982 TaxID=2690291 RepID=UPI00136BE7A2|nr:hypothetical protein [Streptomyces sp. SID4982]MYS16124.1 hypothetical protein [Streptomyces sp. SID4982]